MKKLSLISLVLSLLVLFCFHGSVAAEGNKLSAESSGGKIDAIVIIDASGSMLLTDPLRLRDEGAKLFIQSLKSNDRIAVVEFSDSAKVIHQLSEHKAEKDGKIANEIAKIENKGLYTDLLSGIKVAQDIFKNNPSKDAQQVIVLLSDGKMDPDPVKASPQTQNDALFNNTLPELKAQGIKVHTLAFSDQADKDLLSQIAASTEGIGIYAPDANSIHQAFTNLFLAVKKPQVLPLTSKGFKIDKDVQEATFYVNREGTDQEVSLTSPGGKRYVQTSVDPNIKWFRSQKFDVITILTPEAGNWNIEGMQSQDGFATLLTNLKLVTDWESTISAEEDKLLQVRLYEEEKPVVLHGMSGALEYALQIVPTDKISEPIMKAFLTDDGKNGDKVANDGIFSKLIRVDEPGQYKLKVVAHSPTFDRYQHLPFQVKERLISLKVESKVTSAAPAEHGDEHGDAHGAEEHHDKHASDEHHEEKHGEEKEHAEEHGDAHGEKGHADKDEHKEGGEEDVFVATLSDEVNELKKVEVKLLAIDKDRNRYSVEMHPSEVSNVYELPADALPNSGLYEVEATFSGIGKNKKTQTATSQRIKYLVKKANQDVTVLSVEKKEGKDIKIEGKKPEEAHKEVKAPQEAGPLMYIILATLWNLLAAGVTFILAKKASSGPQVALPVFEDVGVTQKYVATLREKISVSEIDLNDPMFTGMPAVSKQEAKAEEPEAEPAADLTAPPETEQTEEPPAEAPPEEQGEA